MKPDYVADLGVHFIENNWRMFNKQIVFIYQINQ